MAKAQQKNDEHASNPTPESLVGELPDDFSFDVSENVEIPTAAARKTMAPTHPWIPKYDAMKHNESFFVPMAYWLAPEPRGRGRSLEATSMAWQRQNIGNTFTNWKKKAPEERKNWRLVTMAREIGEDATYPALAGVRCWKVDTTR